MGLIVPAVHYSALASLPPDFISSTSQQSIPYTSSIRLKFNQIVKKLFNHERIIASETIEEKDNDQLIVLNNPNNKNTNDRTFLTQTSPSSFIESTERLPFTEPYFSTTKPEQTSFESSIYHKHCIRQEKFIDKKSHHPKPSSTRKTCSEFNKKTSDSTTTLPELSSLEDRIGLQYATRRNSLTMNHSTRSSYNQQQNQQHLRRLQSKSKLRPITNNEFKTSSISSSIAHRIELLKQAMHNHQLEIHSSTKFIPNQSNSLSIFESLHKQTQTIDSSLKSTEVHHIHHHHIYSSSFFSMPWRTYLSIFGTITMIFFLLIQFITINF